MGDFSKEAAIIAQNSGTIAGQLTSAIITANPSHATTTDSALELFDRVREHVFNGAIALAGAGAVVVGTESPRQARGGNRGGGRPASSGGQAAPSGDPGAFVIDFGAAKGKTVAEIYATDKVGRGSGAEYLTWVVSDLAQKKPAAAAAVKAFLESK